MKAQVNSRLQFLSSDLGRLPGLTTCDEVNVTRLPGLTTCDEVNVTPRNIYQIGHEERNPQGNGG